MSTQKPGEAEFIYADFNASAPLCDTVKTFLKERLESPDFANPNAAHLLGRNILKNIERVRKKIAEVLNCEPRQVIYNSGSSEGIANVFFSIFMDEVYPVKKEDSDLKYGALGTIDNAYYYAKKFNQEIVFVPALSNGETDVEFIQQQLACSDDITLVCAMAANNETGVIQPYQTIGKLCEEKDIPFLCDTTQLIGKAPFDFHRSNITYAMASGHKFGSLLGSGFIMAKDPQKITSMVKGGGQEKGLRCGTQNYLAIESMEPTLNNFENLFSHLDKMSKARDEFEAKILEKHPEVMIFGKDSPRVPTTTYMAKKGTIGGIVRDKLEKEGVYITTSSACSDASDNISKVLKAMNIEPSYAAGALRISLCLSCPRKYNDLFLAVDKALS